jgi:hypothetical protein
MTPEQEAMLASLTKRAEAAPDAPTPMSCFATLVEAFLKRVGDLEGLFNEMNDRNVERNRRLDVLEARPKGLVYRGVWTASEKYGVGDVVTRSGAMWICKLADVGATPGVTPEAWQLAVKAGRDGRDLR